MGWMIGVQFSAGAGIFSLHHRVQTGSGVHQASYLMGSGPSLPGDKAAVAWKSPLISIYAEVKNLLNYAFDPPVRGHSEVFN
jgi:hypothetical protein